MRQRVIGIGGSAGALDVCFRILESLSPTWMDPIVICLHVPPGSWVQPDLLFDRLRPRQVVGLEDKMQLEPGMVGFAPPGYHLQIERDLSCSLSVDPPVQYARPSIDVFFESMARSLGPTAVGILLTGANYDGADGMKLIHELGGVTIVQDPRASHVDTMPAHALDLFQPTYVEHPDQIAVRLNLLEKEVIGEQKNQNLDR